MFVVLAHASESGEATADRVARAPFDVASPTLRRYGSSRERPSIPQVRLYLASSRMIRRPLYRDRTRTNGLEQTRARASRVSALTFKRRFGREVSRRGHSLIFTIARRTSGSAPGPPRVSLARSHTEARGTAASADCSPAPELSSSFQSSSGAAGLARWRAAVTNAGRSSAAHDASRCITA
eukprot:392391-Prorocentrum_minimum.AAC.2